MESSATNKQVRPLKEFNQEVDHAIKAILWVTNSGDLSQLPHFDDLNYLVEGLIPAKAEKSGDAIYANTCFGRPFFIYHAFCETEELCLIVKRFSAMVGGDTQSSLLLVPENKYPQSSLASQFVVKTYQ